MSRSQAGPVIAYKLFSLKRDGSIGPLFCNRRQRLKVGEWYPAEDHRTAGLAHRPGWHACLEPVANHLSKKNRVWARCEISDFETIQRPVQQGSSWLLGKQLRVIELLDMENYV
jgi:hypothetical protein